MIVAPRRRLLLTVLCTAVPMAWAFAGLGSMLAGSEPMPGDFVTHLNEVMYLSRCFAQGRLPGWNPQANLGFPLGYYYQWLPHVLLGAVGTLLADVGSILFLFKLTIVIAYGLVPLSVYLGLRGLFADTEAAMAALFVLALDSSLPFGLGAQTWLVYGAWTQLFGGVLIFPALRVLVEAVEGKRSPAAAAAVWAAVLVTHVFYSLLLGGLATAWIVADPSRARLRRLALMAALTGLGTAFFTVPAVVHADYFGGWPWERPWFSHGVRPMALAWLLVAGGLLDAHRPPVLTGFAGIGFLVALVRWRRRGADAHACAFLLVALSLLCAAFLGRATWAWRLDELGLLRDVQWGRYLSGLHVVALVLTGLGAHAAATAVRARLRPRWLATAAVAVPLLWLLTHLYRGPWTLAHIGAQTADDVEPGGRPALQQAFAALAPYAPRRFWTSQFAGVRQPWAFEPAWIHAGTPPLVSGGVGSQDSLSLYYTPQFNAQRARLYAVAAGVYAHGVTPLPAEAAPVAPVHAGPYQVFPFPAVTYFDVVEARTLVRGDRMSVRPLMSAWIESGLPLRGRHLGVSFGAAEPGFRRELTLLPAGGVRDCTADGRCREVPLGAVIRELRAEPPGEGFPGRVLAERTDVDEYAAELEADHDAYAVLKVSFHPNWRAFVDERPAQVVMLSPSFLGVRLPAGRHRVVFRYQRPWFQAPLFAAALITWAAALSPAGRGRLRAATTPPPSPGTLPT